MAQKRKKRSNKKNDVALEKVSKPTQMAQKSLKQAKDALPKNKLARNVAIGASGVAITAGAIAAGALLFDKKSRGKVTKAVSEFIDEQGKNQMALK